MPILFKLAFQPLRNLGRLIGRTLRPLVDETSFYQNVIAPGSYKVLKRSAKDLIIYSAAIATLVAAILYLPGLKALFPATAHNLVSNKLVIAASLFAISVPSLLILIGVFVLLKRKHEEAIALHFSFLNLVALFIIFYVVVSAVQMLSGLALVKAGASLDVVRYFVDLPAMIVLSVFLFSLVFGYVRAIQIACGRSIVAATVIVLFTVYAPLSLAATYGMSRVDRLPGDYPPSPPPLIDDEDAD